MTRLLPSCGVSRLKVLRRRVYAAAESCADYLGGSMQSNAVTVSGEPPLAPWGTHSGSVPSTAVARSNDGSVGSRLSREWYHQVPDIGPSSDMRSGQVVNRVRAGLAPIARSIRGQLRMVPAVWQVSAVSAAVCGTAATTPGGVRFCGVGVGCRVVVLRPEPERSLLSRLCL